MEPKGCCWLQSVSRPSPPALLVNRVDPAIRHHARPTQRVPPPLRESDHRLARAIRHHARPRPRDPPSLRESDRRHLRQPRRPDLRHRPPPAGPRRYLLSSRAHLSRREAVPLQGAIRQRFHPPQLLLHPRPPLPPVRSPAPQCHRFHRGERISR